MLSKLGKYEIEAELGSGGMGVVYRAIDTRLGRAVALKTMSPTVIGNPDVLKRFYREAQAAGQLHHPNIVTIYDIDEAQGIPFIAMELLEGDDLERIIGEKTDLPLFKRLDIIVQTCRGLHYAHAHGVVHRDMKPGNIVVLPNGQVKIVDFGIARIGTATLTRTGSVLGTVLYMSPEQIRSQPVDGRSDIFSVGIILYELLTFRSPFPGDDIPAILFKITHEAPEPLSQHLAHCPADLELIVLKALEKEAESRYQTAEEMALDLQSLADSLRHDTLGIYLKQGERALAEKKLNIAQECLQKVLEIDSSHELAKAMLERVREETVARQRAQKIEQYMRHAQESLDSSQYAEALIFLDEVLRLDPRHEAARQLKQSAVERHERDLRIARHLERAEKCAAAGDLPGAKRELDAVLSLDRQHQTALRMSGWLERELAEKVQQRRAAELAQTGEAPTMLGGPIALPLAKEPPPKPAPRDLSTITTDDAGQYAKAARDPATVTTDDVGPYAKAVRPPSEETQLMPPPAPMPEPPAPTPEKVAVPPASPPVRKAEPPPAPKPTPPPARPAPKPAPIPPRPTPPRPAIGQAPELRPERWVAPAERSFSWIWMGVGALVFLLVAAGAWYLFTRASAPGYVQITASPWAEVTDVRQESGKLFDITGQTPMQIELPPGDYVIELTNGKNTDKVRVKVKSGKVQVVHHAFAQKKSEELVDEVLREY
ncbi:MAG TPA: serine/threonine-protein kinase [Candidatus Xenobia bacterium]|nr:serine/threonine-protein kinase [Candidatus Xenobia bacterium]